MRGADAHPGALVNCALLAVVAVRQMCLASEGGWARLTPAVRPPLVLPKT